jgi:hypothetical protein
MFKEFNGEKIIHRTVSFPRKGHGKYFDTANLGNTSPIFKMQTKIFKFKTLQRWYRKFPTIH